MVAKISVGSSVSGSVIYNANKVKEGEARVLLASKIFCGEDGTYSAHDTIRSFKDSMPLHHSTSNPLFHVSLNPHIDDKLSDAEFSAIAEEYMERLGYGNQPYIVYRHEDMPRHHIHIVSLRVDERGRKINDKFEHRRSKDITRDLERKYGLTPAERRGQEPILMPKKVDVQQGDIKRQVGNVVRHIAPRYHCTTFNEYRALLSLYNISAEEVKGEAKGKAYNGVVYSATDDRGVKVGNPFKSSLFGKGVGYEALQRRFEASKEHLKDKKLSSQTKALVSDALSRSATKELFREELQSRGVDVVLRENDSGRLYGATFIDHNNHCIFNGSKLGKELSANALSEWFENPQVEPPHPTPPQDVDVDVDVEPEPQHQASDASDESLAIGGLFDLPMSGGDDPEEEDFRRRMQRKKRKKSNYKL